MTPTNVSDEVLTNRYIGLCRDAYVRGELDLEEFELNAEAVLRLGFNEFNRQLRLLVQNAD